MNDAIDALFNDRSDSGTQAHHAASGPVQKEYSIWGSRGSKYSSQQHLARTPTVFLNTRISI